MKKKNLIILLAAGLILAMAVITAGYGEDMEPGSIGDPLVTKSYIDNIVDGLKDRLTALENKLGSGEGTAAASSWEVIQVGAGKSVLGGEGTEIVLRSGSASALDNGKDGVSDLTGGADLKGGTAIEKNHLLLVPRQDGRGIFCISSCWVMVLGDYEIK